MLAEQLKLIPDSRIRALWVGGIEFLGWDTAQYTRANLYDLIAALAAGLGGKQLPDSSRYPRPKVAPAQAVDMPSIAEFDISAFMARISSGR